MGALGGSRAINFPFRGSLVNKHPAQSKGQVSGQCRGPDLNNKAGKRVLSTWGGKAGVCDVQGSRGQELWWEMLGIQSRTVIPSGSHLPAGTAPNNDTFFFFLKLVAFSTESLLAFPQDTECVSEDCLLCPLALPLLFHRMSPRDKMPTRTKALSKSGGE